MKNAALFVIARQNVTQLLSYVSRVSQHTFEFRDIPKPLLSQIILPPPNLYVRDYTSKNNTYILLGFVPEFMYLRCSLWLFRNPPWFHKSCVFLHYIPLQWARRPMGARGWAADEGPLSSWPVLPDLCQPLRPALPLILLIHGGDRGAQIYFYTAGFELFGRHHGHLATL